MTTAALVRECRCPDKVVRDQDVARLLASAFLHVDDWHLYHNM